MHMRTDSTPQNGFSLIETLVAIAILLIAIAGPMTIAKESVKTAASARERLTAVFLAQEGVEAMLKKRNEDALDGGGTWDWYDTIDADCKDVSVGCDVNIRDGSVISCDSIENCRLSIDPEALASNERGYFNHEGDGDPSPYTRVITLRGISGDEVEVESTVTWTDPFGQSQSISEVTRLFDHL